MLQGQKQVRIAAHFGELLQGRIGPDGPVALVTCPCPVHFATADKIGDGPLAVMDGGLGVLPRARLARMLRHLGLPVQGRFRLRLTMPPGGGAGASTAALMALARAAGADDPAAITAAALACEGASDPLLFAKPERVLWASRRGQVLRHMAPMARVEVLGGFLGPGRRTDPLDDAFPDISDLVTVWQTTAGSAAGIARLATESALRTLALRGPKTDPTEALAARTGALGFLIAHTGTARGLIFAPGTVPEVAAADMRAAGFSRITQFRCGG